tara:strand:+ start:456 stop:842 length:387 start_codon:yes stop_codon:yes gene_type:complete
MLTKETLQDRVEKMTQQAFAFFRMDVGDVELVIAEDGGTNEVYGETLVESDPNLRNMIESAVYAHALCAATIHQGEYNVENLDPEAFGDIRSEMVDAFKGIFGTPCIDFRGDLVICLKTATEFGRNVE